MLSIIVVGGYSSVEGTILKASALSRGRGAGKIAREAASLPIRAVSKLAVVLKFEAESSFVATAAKKAVSILTSSVASCGRDTGRNRERHFRLWPSCEYEQDRTAVEYEAEHHFQTIHHLAQKQVEPMAKSAAG